MKHSIHQPDNLFHYFFESQELNHKELPDLRTNSNFNKDIHDTSTSNFSNVKAFSDESGIN